MKLFILALLGTIVALISSLLIHLGAFKPVTVAIEEAGPFRLVFKQHAGPYHQIVPVIEEVERWAAESGEKCLTSFGEYLDDPTNTDEDRLHSHGGCVVEGDWAGRLPEGLMYKELPKREYVVAIFDGAPSISPYKVYPKAQDYMASMSLKPEPPVIEMYQRLSENELKTLYYFPFRR